MNCGATSVFEKGSAPVHHAGAGQPRNLTNSLNRRVRLGRLCLVPRPVVLGRRWRPRRCNARRRPPRNWTMRFRLTVVGLLLLLSAAPVAAQSDSALIPIPLVTALMA